MLLKVKVLSRDNHTRKERAASLHQKDRPTRFMSQGRNNLVLKNVQ